MKKAQYKKIYKTVQNALNKEGWKFLHKFETKYKFHISSNLAKIEVPFINNSGCQINDFKDPEVAHVIQNIKPPFNDFWALRFTTEKQFWAAWKEFKKLMKLKAFW